MDIDFKERLFIRADVASKMRFCNTREEKMFVTYKILNSTEDETKRLMYAEFLKEYLSESDMSKVLIETSYGNFDNIDFWINKILQDIIFYSSYNNGYENSNDAKDVVKAAFCIFIDDYVAPLSNNAAIKLLNAVINTPSLKFLHSVAFYEKANINNISEYENIDKNERYLDLLELVFYPEGLLEDINSRHEEEIREYSLNKKRNKKSNTVISQLSFKFMLENA